MNIIFPSAFKISLISLYLYSNIHRKFSSSEPLKPDLSKLRLFSDTKYIGSSVLPFKEDKYNGVIIDHTSLPDTLTDFITVLKSSLVYWKLNERRGVWLKIPIEKSSFIASCVEEGFEFHHAEKTYVMLTNWLSEDENRMPANASHQVGVGCVVIHNGKMLLVQEKSGILKNTGIWKMPTGLVEVGEDITEAGIREVFEETGIEAEFEQLICFRQSHGALFGKSDLFFVCTFKPKTFEIKKQEVEIAKCEWVDPQIYFNQSFFKQSGVYSVINDQIAKYINEINHNEKENILVAEKLPIGFRPGKNLLFFKK